ncbi:MAG: hypothetical protein ACI8S6_002931 [Myxococcota bacterium]|jgi:hypothetical protein
MMLIILLSSAAFAGGWTQPAGAHYLKVWSRTLVGTDGFFADGSIASLDPETRYRDLSLGIYGEYGITDAWTLALVTTPLGHTRLPDDSGLYSGLTMLGARRALLTGDLRLAVEARAGGVPTQTSPRTTGADDAWFWQSVVPTAQAEAELQAGFGWSQNWVTASAGGRWQGADALAPSIIGLVSIGRSGKRLMPSLQVSTVQPLQEVTAANISGAGQTRYIGVEPGLGIRLGEHLSAVVGLGGALAAQANAAAPSLSVGLSHQ